MSLEDIRSSFQKLKSSNNQSFCRVNKKPIPHYYDSISFMAHPNVTGDQVEKLILMLKRNCWHTIDQNRRVIAVVQSYGCGKTKTSLMLCREFVVLPWSVKSKSPLIKWVISKQKQLKKSLITNKKDKIKYIDVEQFSFQCLSLLSSLIRGHVALFETCVENEIIDKNSFIDRFYFALMLLNEDECMKKWIISWADDFFTNNPKNIQEEDSLFSGMENVLKKNIVFVFDEVHETIDKCRGYCFHRDTTREVNISGDDKVNNWMREQDDSVPCPGKKFCTDLFYQLRYIMLISISNENLFAFVMCSTVYRTWDTFEVDDSPFSRGMFEKFFCLHNFTKDEVFDLLLEFFNIEISLDDPDIGRICSYFVRPLFVSEFIEELFNTPFDQNIDSKTWLESAFIVTKNRCLDKAKDRIKNLVDKNYPLDTRTSRGMINFLYTVQRLCGGTYRGFENDEITLIIGSGVGQINDSSDRFRINDPIFIDALNQICYKEKGIMMEILDKKQGFNNALTSQDRSQKGFLTERALCCVILEHQNPYPTDAYTAGTTQEIFYNKFESVSEAEFLIQVAEGKNKFVLLPTPAAGPDIWYRTADEPYDSSAVVAIQSKCENVVFCLNKLKEALKSLNPNTMFSFASESCKKYWKSSVHIFSKLKFYRCIFSASGFNRNVYYIVSEYNKKNPQYLIYLYHLDDIKSEFRGLYHKLKLDLKIKSIKVKPNDAIYQDDWNKLSRNQKNTESKKVLVGYCKDRGINTCNTKEQSKKRSKEKNKMQLIQSIDSFDLDKEINQLLLIFN